MYLLLIGLAARCPLQEREIFRERKRESASSGSLLALTEETTEPRRCVLQQSTAQIV